MSTMRYRRGTFFWALILIAIGAIFLDQNFNPAVHPWSIIARYWPVLIIIWGISKLMDYFQARAHPDLPAPSMFSGSDVILLILILLLGTFVSHLVLAPWQRWRRDWGIHFSDNGWNNPFLHSYTYTHSLGGALPLHAHLLVDDRRGDVQIKAAPEASFTGLVTETIRATNEEDARKIEQQLKLGIVSQDGRSVIHPDLDSLPGGGGNVRLDITLNVPESTAAEVTTRNGDVLVDGLHGSETVVSGSGAIHLVNVQGSVVVEKSGGSTSVREVQGSVQVSGSGGDVQVTDVSGPVSVTGEFTGLVRFQQLSQGLQFTSSRTHLTARNVAGKLEMQMGSLEATNIDGPLEVATAHKDINIAGFKEALTISDSGGNIILQAAPPLAGPIVVKSKNGDIELTLPPASNFVVNATSENGQVDSDFRASSLAVNSQGDKPSIQGSYGHGGPTIRLFTTYGTVHLIRATPGSGTPRAAGEQAELNVEL
jgi:DUF4097 and DUF4098 domain-containing protein YvlB